MPTTSRLHQLLASACVALACNGSAWAISDAQFTPAFDIFMQATRGNDAAVDRAADAFAALLNQEPGNPVLLAYSGAATAMKAGASWLPWKKMAYAEDGMAQLDKALSLLGAAHTAPLQHAIAATLEVRFVAASSFLAVPGFMNRGDRGAKLLGEVLASPLLAGTPLGFRGDVWMKAAELALKQKRSADARRYWGEVVQAQAPQAQAARAHLQGLAP
ncbi:MAG: hypothetical protein ACR2I0_04655 [Rhodoferax sp.]